MTIARAVRRLLARVPATGLPPIFTAVYRPAPRPVAADPARASAPDRPRLSAP
jgi:hypothetical protein